MSKAKIMKKSIIKATNDIINTLFDKKINKKDEFYKVIALVLSICCKVNNTKIDFNLLETLTENTEPIIGNQQNPKHPLEEITREQAERITKKINEEAKNGSN